MSVGQWKNDDIPTMDGREVTAALEIEEAARESWHTALDVLSRDRSTSNYEAALTAAQSYYDATQRVRKAMRIDEVIARARINHGF